MKYLLIALMLCFAVPAEAARAHPESYYQNIWCTAHSGVTEHVLPDRTRVDCLLPDYAIEFDFADKWAESIGQAVYYGAATNRPPGIVLIMENPERDLKYVMRLFRAIQARGGKIRVWFTR